MALFRPTHAFSWLMLTAVLLTPVQAEEKPQAIEPGEARDYEGKLVSVTFKVKATKNSKHRRTVFLDSEEDFQHEENLGITLSESVVAELRQQRGISSPADYFLGKGIRAVGKIIVREKRPYLDVKGADQLEEVKDTSTTESQ